MSIQTEVLSNEARNGMSYRREIWTMEGNPPLEMEAVYSVDGVYVGDVVTADFLAGIGIAPEPRTAESSVCSIGFSEKDQKWYGWSHRAMCGFGIGSVAKDGDIVCDEGIPVGFEAKTLDDARTMAVAYAANVS